MNGYPHLPPSLFSLHLLFLFSFLTAPVPTLSPALTSSPLYSLSISGAALSLFFVARFLGTRRRYVARRCPCIASSLLQRHYGEALSPAHPPRASEYLTRVCFTLSPEVRPVCILFCSARAVSRPAREFFARRALRRTSLFPSLPPAS